MKKIKEIKIVNQDQSTEVANIGADAINVDYNDTTVKAELDKLNNNNNVNKNNITNLQTELSTANSNLELQTSRIDNLVHLDEGSTTGDAELIDGRVGYDDIIYNNIGTAIREQISNLHNIAGDNVKTNYDISFFNKSTSGWKNTIGNDWSIWFIRNEIPAGYIKNIKIYQMGQSDDSYRK